MSSSEYLKRLPLLDLQQEVPPPLAADFTVRSEFPRKEVGRTGETTPEEAHRTGLIEGEQRGRAGALKELAPVLEELRSIAGSMATVRQQRLTDAEAELARVGAEAARRILHGELQQAEDAVIRMVRACIEEVRGEEGLRLHVSPSDLELVRAHLPELELDLAEGSVELQADPSIPSGSVVLDTPLRCYDGRPSRILEHAIRETGLREAT